MIATSGELQLSGTLQAWGSGGCGFDGSGGAVRLVASRVSGSGLIEVRGYNSGGDGWVRIDTPDYSFGGNVTYLHGPLSNVFTRGYQPIIIQTNGQGAQLTVTSVGGVPVSASPSGQLATPDAVLSAQQNNPIPIVVHCSNIPLNTQITVSVKPANGAAVSATGLNSVGTLSSSTATVLINMPRGGGIIYATAAN